MLRRKQEELAIPAKAVQSSQAVEANVTFLFIHHLQNWRNGLVKNAIKNSRLLRKSWRQPP